MAWDILELHVSLSNEYIMNSDSHIMFTLSIFLPFAIFVPDSFWLPFMICVPAYLYFSFITITSSFIGWWEGWSQSIGWCGLCLVTRWWTVSLILFLLFCLVTFCLFVPFFPISLFTFDSLSKLKLYSSSLFY